MKSLVLVSSIFLAGSAIAAEISRDDLKKALDKNPDLVLDVLKNKKAEVFSIIIQAQQEEQGKRQKEEEEAARKEFNESFKHPYAPVIDEKTRIRGRKDAKYTLVEYSDFQCPFCARGYQTVEALRKKYDDKIRFIFKNLPLSNMHPQALPAAQYLEAAALQSPEKAWDFHDKMFNNQQQLGEPFFKDTAKSLGLDLDKLDADVKGAAVKAKIDADMEEAHKFGFTGTPGFLLNGIPVRGAYPVDKFDEIVKKLDEKKD